MVGRIALLLGIAVGIKTLTKTVKEDFKAAVDPAQFKVKIESGALLVSSGLQVNNYSNAELTVDNIRISFGFIQNGVKTNIATSVPSSKEHKITPLSTSRVPLPEMRIGALVLGTNILKATQVFLNDKDKFYLVVEGAVNGFTFGQTILK